MTRAAPRSKRVFNKEDDLSKETSFRSMPIEPRVTYKYQTQGSGTDYDRFVRFDENDLMVNT